MVEITDAVRGVFGDAGGILLLIAGPFFALFLAIDAVKVGGRWLRRSMNSDGGRSDPWSS